MRRLQPLSDRTQGTKSQDPSPKSNGLLPMAEATFKIFRGDRSGGDLVEYKVPIAPGMVVLDALHYIQAHQAPDLAVRWNCKAGKCGSCSAEVNGRPRLTCKTRMDSLP